MDVSASAGETSREAQRARRLSAETDSDGLFKSVQMMRWVRIFMAYFGLTLAIRSFLVGFTLTAITVSCVGEN